MKFFSWKFFLSLVGVLLAVAVAGYLAIVKTVTAPWLQNRLEQVVVARTDSLYTLTLDSIYIDIPAGIFQVHNVTLKPRLPVPKGKAELNVAFSSLEINRVRWLPFVLTRNLHISSIRLKNPVISLREGNGNKPEPQDEPDTEPDSARDVRELLQLIPPFVRPIAKTLRVDTLSLENGNLEVRGSSRLIVDSLDAAFRELRLTGQAESPVTATDFLVEIAGVDYWPKGGNYHLVVREMGAAVADSSLKTGHIELRMRRTDEAFFKHSGFRGIRYKITAEGINAGGFDYQKLLFDRDLDIRVLSLGWLRLDLLSDNRFPRRNPNSPFTYKKFPHEQFQQIELPVRIDSVVLNRFDFVFREHPEASRPGSPPSLLSFEKSKVQVTGIAKGRGKNVPADTVQLTVKSLFMGKAKAELFLSYPMKPGPWEGIFRGKISELHGADLNPLTGPMARLEFRERTIIHKLEFRSEIKKGHAKGVIHANYEHLSIRILRKNSDDARRIASALGNFVLLGSNIDKAGKESRKGTIDMVRDTTKGFPVHLWKQLQTGLMEILLPPAALDYIKKSKAPDAAQKKAEHAEKQTAATKKAEKKQEKKDAKEAKATKKADASAAKKVTEQKEKDEKKQKAKAAKKN